MKLVNQLEEDFENLLVVIKVQLVLFALGKHDCDFPLSWVVRHILWLLSSVSESNVEAISL